MKDNLFSFLLILLLVVLLVAPCRRQDSSSSVTCKDSTVVNVVYRDSTVYRVRQVDSTVIDYTLVPHTELRIDTVRDTAFIYVPVSWHHYADSMADIYVSGYRVSLDSVRYHFREVTHKVTERVIIKPRRLSIDAGFMVQMGKAWGMGADVAMSLRLGELWSVEGSVGLMSEGSSLTPYVGAGVRYRVW